MLSPKSLFDQAVINYKGTQKTKIQKTNRSRNLSVVFPSSPPPLPVFLVFRTGCGSHFPFLTEKHIIEKESSTPTPRELNVASQRKRETASVSHARVLIISKAGEHSVKDEVCRSTCLSGGVLGLWICTLLAVGVWQVAHVTRVSQHEASQREASSTSSSLVRGCGDSHMSAVGD